MSEFKCCYGIYDGYNGKSRQEYFNISSDDIFNAVDDFDLQMIFEEHMQENFEMNIRTYGKNKEAFIEWGLKIIEKLNLECGEE